MLLNQKKARSKSEEINKLNKYSYEEADIIEFYTNFEGLTPPEQTILNIFKSRLPKMSVLDIGVGGGRTTKHFAPLSRDYIGIDYSSRMIEACRKKFSKLKFEVADVRNLSMFDDYCFDFTLFSNNGLDYMSYENRKQALKEMYRVTKHGYVCFSTHNLNNIPRQFKPNFYDKNGRTFGQIKVKLKGELYRIYRLSSENSHILLSFGKKYLFFNDGAHGFRFMTYYVRPEEQVTQLENLNYRNIRVFGEDGKEILSSKLNYTRDFYLYFVARIDALIM